MRLLNAFILAVAAMSAPAEALAQEWTGKERPVHMSFRYFMDGPLYEKLAEEFKPETEAADPGTLPLLGIHEVDLNGDDVPEYIVRLTDTYFMCNNMGCHHGVVAVDENGVTRLGYFQYAELDVSTEKTAGVKDLLVYDNPLNDFAPTVYKWDNESSEYLRFE